MAIESAHAALRSRSAGWIVWLALGVVWFVTVPWRPLFDPDEGRYAEIPREMLASGDWVTPRLDGLKYFEKPPLQYWATAAVYSVFGLSEWSARAWTVGLAFACLPMLFFWTRRFYGESAANGALFALAASPYFEIVGHLNLLDAGFTCWLVASALAFTLAQQAVPSSSSERRWMLLSWVAAALAVLSKGIVVGVLCGVSLAAYALVERDWRAFRRLHVLTGGSLFLLITAPWFVAVSRQNPSFAAFFFVHEHFARFLTTVHQRIEPWWFFIVIMLIAVLPWASPLVTGTRAVCSETRFDNRFKPLKFLLIFSVVTILFFSLSGSKLAPYVLPALPPLAAAAGVGIAERGHLLRRIVALSGAYLIVVAIGFVIYSRQHGAHPSSAAGWWLVAGGATALGSIVAGRRIRSAAMLPPVGLATALVVLAWQFLMMAFADTPPPRSAYAMLRAVRPLVGPNTQLFSVGQYRETISPYLERTMPLVDFTGELAFGLSEEPSKLLSDADFLTRWRAAPDAIAFLDPQRLAEWQRRGLVGRIVSEDEDTVAVSRL